MWGATLALVFVSNPKELDWFMNEVPCCGGLQGSFVAACRRLCASMSW